MKKIKVSLLVRGSIICTGEAVFFGDALSLRCRPDAEIPAKFVQRIYHGNEPEDCTEVEYDTTNAVVANGNVRIESLIALEGGYIVATGDVIAGMPADFTPPAFTDDFNFEPVPEGE